MRVEIALIQQTLERQDAADPPKLKVDLQSRKRPFEKYRDRTLIEFSSCFSGVRSSHPTCKTSPEHFASEWSGNNPLLYYGPTLVRRMRMTNDLVSLIVSGGIGVMQFVAVLPAIVWIDKVGRRLRGSYPFLTLMAENLVPTD
jgi:hypothetical protein